MNRSDFVFDPGYLRLLGKSALVGLLTGISAVIFLGAEYLFHELVWSGRGTPTGWFSGSLYAVLVVLLAGALVGWLRLRFAMPGPDPNFVDELIEGEVDPQHAARIGVIGLVSLIGGASVGPEAPLGSVGAGIGTKVAQVGGGDREERADLTFAGISAVFGGLGSFAYAGPIMAMEVYHPRWSSGFKRLVPGLVAAVTAFVVIFPAVGTPFLEVYDLDAPDLAVWWVPVAILLGLLGALVGLSAVLLLGVAARVARLVPHPVVRGVTGAAVIALIGFAVPLTMFSGRGELGIILDAGLSLGFPLLAMVVLGKLVAFAVSMRWGFFGGPLFPMLFLGGVCGTVLSEVIPGLPLVLAVTTVAAGACATLIPLPLMVIVLTSMLFGLSVELTVLPSVAAVTAYLLVHGTGLLGVLAARLQPSAPAEPSRPGT
ncbi:MAG: chloride channel protein [Ornithinimicrobium sp.]